VQLPQHVGGGVVKPADCKTCHDEGVLVSYECINGREVDVSEPCPDCDEGGENFQDREERQRAALDEHFDRVFEERREQTLMLFGAGWRGVVRVVTPWDLFIAVWKIIGMASAEELK
jgi:hypothetical protein